MYTLIKKGKAKFDIEIKGVIVGEVTHDAPNWTTIIAGIKAVSPNRKVSVERCIFTIIDNALLNYNNR